MVARHIFIKHIFESLLQLINLICIEKGINLFFKGYLKWIYDKFFFEVPCEFAIDIFSMK